MTEVDGREAIILTRPHVVAEFFHVDWTSRARRKIGVPVLHLLEHENFDEQAGAPARASRASEAGARSTVERLRDPVRSPLPATSARSTRETRGPRDVSGPGDLGWLACRDLVR